VAESGTPAASTETFVPFTAPQGVQRIEGTLTWFGGPVVDLDLYLLDANSNVLQSSASSDPSEHLVYNTPVPGEYRWKIVSYVSPDTAEYAIDMAQCIASALVGVDSAPAGTVRLSPSAPNPFTSSTLVAFALPAAGRVSLRLYDVAGRLVRTLEEGELPAGNHTRVWNRRTDRGTTAAPGVYFYRLEAGGKRLGEKVVIAH